MKSKEEQCAKGTREPQSFGDPRRLELALSQAPYEARLLLRENGSRGADTPPLEASGGLWYPKSFYETLANIRQARLIISDDLLLDGSETSFQHMHNKIVEEINGYDSNSIINQLVQQLHHSTGSTHFPLWKVCMGRFPFPWIPMLLIRWALQYYEQPAKPKRAIDPQKLDDLCDEIFQLSRVPVFNSLEQVSPPLGDLKRRLNTQSRYQFDPTETIPSIGRQLLLFCDKQQDNKLDKIFSNETGIHIEEFIEMYFMCWRLCETFGCFFASDLLGAGHCVDRVEKFLNLFAPTMEQASCRIKCHRCKTNAKPILSRRAYSILAKEYTRDEMAIAYEVHEQSPLERFPLFRRSDRIMPYSPMILEHGCRSILYGILKQADARFPGDYLGEVFENYVGCRLKSLNANFKTEKEIQIPGEKCADFWVSEQLGAILIDAKSTESRSHYDVIQDIPSIHRNIENSISSGVIQIIATDNLLRRGNDCKISPGTPSYGIIVTYGDYFHTWATLGKHIHKQVETELNKRNLRNDIPHSHFFFVGIDGFDYLIEGSRQNKMCMSQVLSAVAERYKDPTASFLFKYLVSETMGWGDYPPEHLCIRWEKMRDSLLSRLHSYAQSE